MPERGAVAPLSPREEVMLRRVALGVSASPDPPQREVDRLKKLGLVHVANGALRLTPLGEQRYSKLRAGGPS